MDFDYTKLYLVDGGLLTLLARLRTRLYANDYKRLSGDEIRDFANEIDVKLRVGVYDEVDYFIPHSDTKR